MGMLIEARCGCGYVADRLIFGAPMIGFQTHRAVPARCDTCRQVVVIDWVGAANCPICGGAVVSYAQPGDGQSPAGTTWRAPGGEQLVLPSARNACPRCGAADLSFAITGAFD